MQREQIDSGSALMAHEAVLSANDAGSDHAAGFQNYPGLKASNL